MRHLLFSSIILITLVAYSTKESKKEEIKSNVQGSWELISYIDHENNKKGWQKYGDEIIYQKHITDDHFTWYQYNKTQDRLLGMGGGSYIITDDGKYVENIEFFYPPGSSELGQSIPFTIRFEDSKWYHTGKAKEMELSQDGSMIQVGSIKIEEIWSPMLSEKSNKYDLIGTWDLEKFREAENDPYIEYPVFTGYMKLITPSHFIWIKYDREGDQIFAAGAGPYVYDGNEYVEELQMVYPSNSGQVGTSITFEPIISAHRWDHLGMAPIQRDGSKNALFIDEVWEPHECDPDMEIGSNF